MSAFTLATGASAHVAAAQSAVVPMAAGPGFLDWAGSLNTEVQSLILGVSITLGILFVVIQGVASRGSMARIIVAAIGAGIFVWVVYNITTVRDSVGNELPGAAPAVEVMYTGPLTDLPQV